MKKTALFLLAAGALAFIALPANAQSTTTTTQAKKEAQKNQVTQSTANAATPAKQINPATGVPATAPAAPAKAKPGATVEKSVPPPMIVTPTPAKATPPAVNPAPANPAAASQVAPAAPAVPLTCTWDVTDYDFGKNVTQLKPASATFNITNAGKDPVTITLVQPSCGCTSPKYTKEPIKPGEKGEVVLTYDAKISGFFSKSATVKLNDGQKYALTIKGEVQKVEQTPPTTPPVVK